jgi:hypothetical protein
MLSKLSFTYYQPEWYHDDGTNIDYGGTPDELFSFQAFRTEEECREWLINHDYNPDEFVIHEYSDDDIEGVTIIDEYGDVIPKIEDLSDEEMEDLLADEVLLMAGSIDNLHATRQSDETEDQFKDRVYGEALDDVNAAIESIEESGDFDFSSYGGNPDVEWYDEARDGAVRIVMDWMLEDYPY